MSIQELTVLLVDDEPLLLKASRLLLLSNGFTRVETISDSLTVMDYLASNQVGVVVLDLFMPNLSGLELLPQIVNEHPNVPVLIMTAVDETATAVNCMKIGAYDFLVKPVETDRLVTAIRKALEHRALLSELNELRNVFLTDHLENEQLFDSIITCSKKMRSLFQYMEVIARSRQPILISGETGVGKELVAKALHLLSGSSGDFVAVNVAGLDDNMFSDTLFGHKKGAFTGADHPREGLIAKAAGGTLFLDEIGDLNEQSQIKLLRLLQEMEYYPVGSDVSRITDARLLLATNHDLQKLINSGTFRKDLYYRICSHRLTIPPLRERPEDIPLLLNHFLATAAVKLGKKKPTPPPELNTLLSTYNFPGNVRELEAMIHDAVARHSSGVLSMESFSTAIGTGVMDLKQYASADGHNRADLLESLFGHFPSFEEVESFMIDEALKKANGNQGIAALMLGITRQTLNKRLKNHAEI